MTAKTFGFTAIIDSREQTPLSLRLAPDQEPLKSERGTLYTGDYSVKGLEDHIAIERKSLTDLMSCIGTERERFKKELQRMLAYPVRAVVVEATWADIENGAYLTRSKIAPAAAIGSVLGWVANGIPFIMSGNHDKAGEHVARLLWIAASRRYRELKALSL